MLSEDYLPWIIHLVCRQSLDACTVPNPKLSWLILTRLYKQDLYELRDIPLHDYVVLRLPFCWQIKRCRSIEIVNWKNCSLLRLFSGKFSICFCICFASEEIWFSQTCIAWIFLPFIPLLKTTLYCRGTSLCSHITLFTITHVRVHKIYRQNKVSPAFSRQQIMHLLLGTYCGIYKKLCTDCWRYVSM